MTDLLIDWLTMLTRWGHLLAGIIWVGTSFYFNWLDSLIRSSGAPTLRENNRGVFNETHGGNFYYHEQYFPNTLPPGLHAHAWPSKLTFISGLMLLVLVYWLHASSYMVDRQVANIEPWMAIAGSLSSIVLFWLIYNHLCRHYSDNRVIFASIAVITILTALGFQHMYGGRAAWISVGVMLGSTMGLNVWLVIAPKSIHMQRQLQQGNGFNHDDGFEAKRRSQHNNYFTIPVLITMVSNHFSAAYSHPWAWLILSLLMFAGWAYRHTLNSRYKSGKVLIALPISAVLAVFVAIGFSLWRPAAALSVESKLITSDQALKIVHARCTSCHSIKPEQPGFIAAPQGMKLDTLDELKAATEKVMQRTVVVRDMPLGNLTGMTEEEREQLGQWLTNQKTHP